MSKMIGKLINKCHKVASTLEWDKNARFDNSCINWFPLLSKFGLPLESSFWIEVANRSITRGLISSRVFGMNQGRNE